MRWRICNGLVPGQAVDAYIKEAAHYQTQDGEQDYKEYFHGCLLWTYYMSEVNTCSDEIGVIARRSFFCHCESQFIGTKQSGWKIELPSF